MNLQLIIYLNYLKYLKPGKGLNNRHLLGQLINTLYFTELSKNTDIFMFIFKLNFI